MTSTKEKLRQVKYKLFRQDDPHAPLIEAIPDLEVAKKYEQEEYFYLAYMSVFIAFFVVWLTITPDLIDLLLVYFPSIGPIPAFWVVNITLGLFLLFLGMLVRQAKINYMQKLTDRANAYPVITGTITEMVETGYTVKHFQFAVQDIRKLASGGDEIQLHTNPGNFIMNPNDHMYILTTAYTDPTDIMHQFPIITEHSIDDHLALKRFEDVFFGLVGINRQVSKLHFVVPARIQDQKPILYIAHSAVTIDQILQRQVPKPVDQDEIYAAERLYALTQGERLTQETVQQRARITELEEQARRYRLDSVRKTQDHRKEKSHILTPEEDHIKFFGGYLKGWKLTAVLALIIITIFIIVFLGGSYFALW